MASAKVRLECAEHEEPAEDEEAKKSEEAQKKKYSMQRKLLLQSAFLHCRSGMSCAFEEVAFSWME